MTDLPTIAFVIPTKDRPVDIRTMLTSLADQDVAAAQVIVVDSSAALKPELATEYPTLAIDYVEFQGKPSAAAQRNDGALRVRDDIDLVCFFDDDQVILPGALRAMLAFWREASAQTAGAGFNLVNEIDGRPSLFKRSALSQWLGLYSQTPGAVAPSGWQALPGIVREDLDVEWITTGAVVWRRDVLRTVSFDEFFDGYSYLEDLDFSYSVSRSNRLVIVADSHVHHFPSKQGRIGLVRFGQIEVRNRLYFVRKHSLSVPRCFLALGIRFFMSLLQGVVMPWKGGLARAWGNLTGLFKFAGAGRAA
ncbi:MAG: glycosyltransferase [Planctomycetota bacterium]|nr:glycosyltransferase [Planctomycetota bacterium]